MSERPADHDAHNRLAWDRVSSEYQDRHAGQLSDSGGAAWGVWQIPESELNVLGDVSGLDVLEFGCGAAQWSIALHARGARVSGLDNSAVQLGHARRLMDRAGVDFPLIHSSATGTPLADESFDIVFCDHGAMTFADPYRTIPEASRLLRPGGLLAFSMGTPILDLAWAADSTHPGPALVRDYWDMHALEIPDEPTSFQLPYGVWISTLRAAGFVIDELIELRPAADAASSYRDDEHREWARRWPMEHIWKARRQ